MNYFQKPYKKLSLFKLLCFLVLVDFFAMFAKFLKPNLFRCVNFISGCYIIPVFANGTDKCNFDPLFSFACHNILLLPCESLEWESDPHSNHYPPALPEPEEGIEPST